jgi:flagellar biosynthesis protein FlhF
MSLQTFQAPSMAEALAQVKRAFGHTAEILHTRNVQRSTWLGLRRVNLVEVTARAGNPNSPRRNVDASAAPRPSGQPASQPAGNIAAAAYARNSAATSRAQVPPGRNAAVVTKENVAASTADPRALMGSPELTRAMVNLMSEQVVGLRSELRDLAQRIGTGPSTTDRQAVALELRPQYQRLLDAAVPPDLAADLVNAVKVSIPPAYLANAPFVRERLIEQVGKLLATSGPVKRTKAIGPHVVALVGPTGVGKTTTIAKLAADLQLREGQPVGLITIDTYRIAAVDQLRRYAEIIGSPLKVVSTPAEMGQAIAALAEMSYVLIDTAGRSPADTLKLSELRGFLDVACPDEVHLVVSSTSEPRSLDLAVSAFGKSRVDRVLLTKVDESAGVGAALEVLRKSGKPLSYITTGQDVPDDIEVATSRKFAERIVGEAVDNPVDNPAASVKSAKQARVALSGGVK